MTIGTGIVDPPVVDKAVIFAAVDAAIVGVGASRRLFAVRWGVAERVVWAWVLTIPGTALIAAVLYELTP